MEAHVVETSIGLFILDQESKVLEAILFSPEPPTAAVQMKELQEGKLTPTILAALKRVASSYDPLVFENQSLANASKREGNLNVAIKTNPMAEQFRNRLGSEWEGRDRWIKQQSLDSPVLKTAKSYNEFSRQVTMQIARTGVAQAASRRDLSGVQAVRAMDDLDKTLNLLANRVREWYGLHFPEMDRIIEKHDTVRTTRRKACFWKSPQFYVPESLSRRIAERRDRKSADAAKRGRLNAARLDDLVRPRRPQILLYTHE